MVDCYQLDVAGWLAAQSAPFDTFSHYVHNISYIYITFMCSFSSKYNNKKKGNKKRWDARARGPMGSSDKDRERECVEQQQQQLRFLKVYHGILSRPQHNEFTRSKCRKMKGVVWRMDKRDFYSYCSAPYPYIHTCIQRICDLIHTLFLYMYIVDISLSSCGNEFLCCFLSYFEYMSVRAKRRFSFKKKNVFVIFFFLRLTILVYGWGICLRWTNTNFVYAGAF